MATIALTVIKKDGVVVSPSVQTLFDDTDFIEPHSNGAGGTAFSINEGKALPTKIEVSETVAQIQTLLGYAPTSDTETVKKVHITLSSAQLLALHTTPISVVAAPGSGKAIEVVSAIAKNTFVSAAYASAQMNLHYESNVGTGADILGSFTQGFVQSGATARQKASLTANHNVYSNKGIYVAVPTADPITGDGSVDIYLEYRVVTE